MSRDFLQNTGMIRIAGFLDEESRQDNKPILVDSIKTYEGFTGNSLEEAYTWLKEKYTMVSQPMLPNPNYDPTDPSSLSMLDQSPIKVPGEFGNAVDA